jgi:ABC-type uncharacterized transport system substrate-binding protein
MKIVLAVITTLLSMFAAPLDAVAQAKPARIAYVWLFAVGPSAPYVDHFRSRLAELGWKEGQTVKTEYYDALGDPRKLDSIMEELVRSKVDIIVAMCTPEAFAAKKFTSTIPIVVTAVGDPVGAGLVTNLSRPGGNLTGVSGMWLPLSAKRVELLKEAFPRIKRATVLWNPVRSDNVQETAAMRETAKRLGFELQSMQVRTREELATALEMMETDGTQAILTAGDTLITLEAPAIVRRAIELRIPAMYESRLHVDLGGLMSYGPSLPEMHRRAADYVDKILKGARPGDLPIEQPTNFELIINRKAAKSQGFQIPESVLVRADEVID